MSEQHLIAPAPVWYASALGLWRQLIQTSVGDDNRRACRLEAAQSGLASVSDLAIELVELLVSRDVKIALPVAASTIEDWWLSAGTHQGFAAALASASENAWIAASSRPGSVILTQAGYVVGGGTLR